MKINVNRVNEITKQFIDVEFGTVFYKSDTEDFYIKIPLLYDNHEGCEDAMNAIHLETGEPDYFNGCEFVIIPHRAEMIIDP